MLLLICDEAKKRTTTLSSIDDQASLSSPVAVRAAFMKGDNKVVHFVNPYWLGLCLYYTLLLVWLHEAIELFL